MDLGEEMDDQDQEPVDFSSPESPASPFSPGPSVETPLPILSFYNKSITAEKLADLSVSDLYEYWMQKFESGQLNEQSTLEMMREYWIKIVPHVYKLEANQDCLAPFKEAEDMVEKFLIEPLAWFLTQSECSSDFLTQVQYSCENFDQGAKNYTYV